MQRTLNFLMPDQQAPDRNERKNSLLNCGVSTGSLHQINCLVLDALGFFQRVETTFQETELSTTTVKSVSAERPTALDYKIRYDTMKNRILVPESINSYCKKTKVFRSKWSRIFEQFKNRFA